MNKIKTFILLLVTIIISGCSFNHIYEAKAKAWGELQCKSHEGLYTVEVTRTLSLLGYHGVGYCNDGTFIMEELTDFTHPIVKDYLKKKEDK